MYRELNVLLRFIRRFFKHVWPPAQFCLFPFSKKSLIGLRQINYTLLGKYFSHLFLPATGTSLSQALEEHSELTWRDGLQGPSTRLLHCFLDLQRYKDVGRCVAPSVEFPKTPSIKTDGHRDYVFLPPKIQAEVMSLLKLNQVAAT